MSSASSREKSWQLAVDNWQLAKKKETKDKKKNTEDTEKKRGRHGRFFLEEVLVRHLST